MVGVKSYSAEWIVLGILLVILSLIVNTNALI